VLTQGGQGKYNGDCRVSLAVSIINVANVNDPLNAISRKILNRKFSGAFFPGLHLSALFVAAKLELLTSPTNHHARKNC
jgi:hypothetical protein